MDCQQIRANKSNIIISQVITNKNQQKQVIQTHRNKNNNNSKLKTQWKGTYSSGHGGGARS